MRHITNLATLPLLACLVASLLPGFAHGFFPWNWRSFVVGLGAVSHQAQTRNAFAETAKAFFGIERLTNGMIAAQKTIVLYNAYTDKSENQKYAEYHFDGESFDEGQKRLVEAVAEIKSYLTYGDGYIARQILGGALHTLQDFYSHTNWVESLAPGEFKLYPGLGENGTVLKRPDNYASVTTCRDCEGTPLNIGIGFCPDCSKNLVRNDFLTSGYIGGDNRDEKVLIPPSVQKCHHGGLPQQFADGLTSLVDGRLLDGINKDSFNCRFSPHGAQFHDRAQQLAQAATIIYLQHLRDVLPARDLKLLYGVGPSLGFAVDTTGSMGSVIAAVRQQTIQIVNDRISNVGSAPADIPSQFVLVPFNDPSTEAAMSYSDPDEFKAALGRLGASGGGDCPERSMAGMLDAIRKLNAGGNLFVITDASAKDPELAGQVIQEAKAKDIRIYIFLFDSGCSTEPLYYDIGRQTGGRAYSLPKSAAGGITTKVSTDVRSDYVSIYEIDTVNKATARAFRRHRRDVVSLDVPVDPSLTAITFDLGGDGTSLSLARPDGSIVQPTDPGVSSIDVVRGRLLTINTPVAGIWKASITNFANSSFSVSGLSSLKFAEFDFVKLTGRDQHQGYFPIDGYPTPGSEAELVATLEGDFAEASFELRDLSGGLISPIVTQAGSGELGAPPKNSFFGKVSLTGVQGKVYVKGKDKTGAIFQRVYSVPVLANGTASNGNGTNTTMPTNGTSTTNSTSTSAPYPYPNATSTGNLFPTAPPTNTCKACQANAPTTVTEEVISIYTVCPYGPKTWGPSWLPGPTDTAPLKCPDYTPTWTTASVIPTGTVRVVATNAGVASTLAIPYGSGTNVTVTVPVYGPRASSIMSNGGSYAVTTAVAKLNGTGSSGTATSSNNGPVYTGGASIVEIMHAILLGPFVIIAWDVMGIV